MKKIVQKDLGQVLVENKLITAADLQEATQVQKEKGGLIGPILVTLGAVTEEVIAQALTTHYGFPYLPLASYEVDVEVARLIPEQVAKQYGLIAVDKIGNVITVAMSNPLNIQAIEDIEMITHYKVEIFVAITSDINEAHQHCYGMPG